MNIIKCIVMSLLSLVLMSNVVVFVQAEQCTHDWSDWRYSIYDCSKGGYRYRQCQICYEWDKVDISPSEHKWSDWEYNTYCEQYGDKRRDCLVCNQYEEEDLDPIGHKYIISVSKKGDMEQICTRCGEDGDYLDETVAIRLSSTEYTENGMEHYPTVTVYLYDPYDKRDIGKIASSNYDIAYSGDGKKIGKYTVKVTFKNKYIGTMNKSYYVVKNDLNKKTVDLYFGKSFQLKLGYAKTKIKWTSNNKKVATVSSKGKVTAKGYGICKITAKCDKKKYTCRITVKHHKPQIEMWLVDYSTRNNTVKVHIINRGKVKLKIYSQGAKLLDDDYTYFDRNLKLSNGKTSITVSPNKQKYITFKVLGSLTWPGEASKQIRINMDYDGKKYTKYTLGHYG